MLIIFLKFSSNRKFPILFYCHFKYLLTLKPLEDSLVFSREGRREDLLMFVRMTQQEQEWGEIGEEERITRPEKPERVDESGP